MRKIKPILRPIFCFSLLFLLVFSTKAQDDIVIVSYVDILHKNPIKKPAKSKANHFIPSAESNKIKVLGILLPKMYTIVAANLITIRELEKRIEETTNSIPDTSVMIKTKLSELRSKFGIQ